MPDRFKTNAEKFSFILSEFAHFREQQAESSKKIDEIHRTMFIKRNGKPGLCQSVDNNTDAIKELKRQNEKMLDKRWQITLLFLAPLIGGFVGYIITKITI